jgi:hypothetical protein
MALVLLAVVLDPPLSLPLVNHESVLDARYPSAPNMCRPSGFGPDGGDHDGMTKDIDTAVGMSSLCDTPSVILTSHRDDPH